MSNIKESNTKKEVNSYLAGDNGDIVSLMENEWPEMTSEFRRLQKEQYELFCHKQHDYGPGNISVGSPLLTEEDIKLSLTGLWFRMNDKIQRLKTLLMSMGQVMGYKPKYRLEVEDGFYENDNLLLLIVQIVLHRTWHLIKHGRWTD